jgi:hypothetical protein
MKDLGLSYEAATHGVQSAIQYEMSRAVNRGEDEGDTSPKHMRVGIDMSKADQSGLAKLLIDKGIFTLGEYLEYMRLAANNELAMREAENPGITFR